MVDMLEHSVSCKLWKQNVGNVRYHNITADVWCSTGKEIALNKLKIIT